MKKAEWLKALEDVAHDSRPGMTSPFKYDGWTVATDGNLMLAVRGELTGEKNEQLSGAAAIETAITGKGMERAGGLTTSVAALEEWADCEPTPECPDCDGRPPEVCEECDGHGELDCTCFDCGMEHYRECPICEGTGRVPLRAHQGRVGEIGGRCINKAFFAKLAQHLPDQPVEVVWPENIQGPVRLIGDDWRALIMPLRDYVRLAEDVDPFVEPERVV